MTPRHIIPTALAALALVAVACGSRHSERAGASGETDSTLTAELRQALMDCKLLCGGTKHLMDYQKHSDADAEL